MVGGGGWVGVGVRSLRTLPCVVVVQPSEHLLLLSISLQGKDLDSLPLNSLSSSVSANVLPI